MGTGGKHIIVIMCISYLACTIHLIPAVRALTGENDIGKLGSPKSVLIGPIGDQFDIEVHRLCWNGIIAASRNRFAFFNAAVPIYGFFASPCSDTDVDGIIPIATASLKTTDLTGNAVVNTCVKKSNIRRSEEHTSELQSLMPIS